jgi:lipopolysaccharide/colanic/teichoic acid biosynthesis glycosyltransferase
LSPVTEGGLYRRGGKRALDLVLGTTMLLILSPLLLAIALAVWLEDQGPALFRQTRVGRDGVAFTLLKFRSMPVGTADLPSKDASGLRVTRVGSVLRRLNLDELPQLFNILAGEMSIVGPRPALTSQTDLLGLRRGSGAMDLRPGLTGLAQIKAYDGMPVEEKAGFDAEYARKVGLVFDFAIVFRTFGYVARRPPVY